MTLYQVTTKDLVIQDQGFRNETYVDSDDPDLSSEEETSPDPDELIQGPSTGFSERGEQKADSAGPTAKANKASKKDQSNQKISEPRKTNVPPPKDKSKPANYPRTGK